MCFIDGDVRGVILRQALPRRFSGGCFFLVNVKSVNQNADCLLGGSTHTHTRATTDARATGGKSAGSD